MITRWNIFTRVLNRDRTDRIQANRSVYRSGHCLCHRHTNQIPGRWDIKDLSADPVDGRILHGASPHHDQDYFPAFSERLQREICVIHRDSVFLLLHIPNSGSPSGMALLHRRAEKKS